MSLRRLPREYTRTVLLTPDLFTDQGGGASVIPLFPTAAGDIIFDIFWDADSFVAWNDSATPTLYLGEHANINDPPTRDPVIALDVKNLSITDVDAIGQSANADTPGFLNTYMAQRVLQGIGMKACLDSANFDSTEGSLALYFRLSRPLG